MPDQPLDRRPRLVLANTSTAQAFTAPSSGGGSSAFPALDRAQHGGALKAQLLALQPIAQQAVAAQKEQGLENGLGLQVQFIGQPDVALAFGSLGYEVGKEPQKKIEVLSVRVGGDTTYANVFVPDEKLAHFEKYVEDYPPRAGALRPARPLQPHRLPGHAGNRRGPLHPIAQQVAAQAAVPVVVTT